MENNISLFTVVYNDDNIKLSRYTPNYNQLTNSSMFNYKNMKLLLLILTALITVFTVSIIMYNTVSIIPYILQHEN